MNSMDRANEKITLQDITEFENRCVKLPSEYIDFYKNIMVGIQKHPHLKSQTSKERLL